ncbi:hypothetical protein ACOME3_005831 [Neoechinorhynchus agilis]
MGQQKSLPSTTTAKQAVLDPNAERLLIYAKRYRTMLFELRKQYRRTKKVAKNLFTSKSAAEINIFEDLNELCSRCWVDHHRSADCTEKLTTFAVSMLQRMQLVDRMYIEIVYKKLGNSIKELIKQDKKIQKQVNDALEPCRKRSGMTTLELERYTDEAFHIWQIQQCLTTDRTQSILSSYTNFQLERFRIYDLCLRKLLDAIETQSLRKESDEFAVYARDAKKEIDKEIERLMLKKMDTVSSEELSHFRSTAPIDYFRQSLTPTIGEQHLSVPQQYY